MNSEVSIKLKKLVKENNSKQLEAFVTDTGYIQILEIISPLLKSSEGVTLLDGVLSALQCITQESLDCRIKIFENVFEHCRIQSTSSLGGGSGGDTLGALVGVLLRQLQIFPSHVLASFMEQYLEHVKIEQPLHGRWVDLFPKLFSCLSNCETVTVDNRELSGDVYKYHVLKTLCSSNWPPETTTTLLLAFKEVNLEKEELSDVVDKVKKVLVSSNYQNVPPIVYNLVLICQCKLPGKALRSVVTYFNEQEEKLALREKKQDEASENKADDASEISCADVTVEAEDLIREKRDLREAEGTVILHLTHLSQFNPGIAKDYIKLMKTTTWLTHILFSPFNLPLSLSLASIDRYEEQILETIKSSLIRSLQHLQKSKQFLWFRKCWQETNVDLTSILRNTINNCTVGWEQVGTGLCHVLLSLLEGGLAFIRLDAAQIAVNTLPLLISKHSHLAQHCIKHITNCILTISNPKYYIEVLGKLSRLNPLLMMEHHNLVRDVLVEQLQYLNAKTAIYLLNSCVSLLKIDIPLRDFLIIALRKMVFSKKMDNRLVSVHGLISILKQLKVSSSLPSSQASLSFSSALSQISCTTQVHTEAPLSRNQSLCFELLGILRRCFSQQHQVKSSLYKGLYDVCRCNPKLCSNILTSLHKHITVFVDLRPNTLNPILLRNVVTMQSETVTLVEPLGDLLSCIASCKIYYEKKREESENAGTFNEELDDDDEEDVIAVLNDICNLFDVLVNKLTKCDMDDLDLHAGMEFSATTNGLKNTYYAQTMVGVYEALMQHSFNVKSSKNDSKMEETMSLFKMRNKIVDLIKNKSLKTSSKKSGESSKSKAKNPSLNLNFNTILKFGIISDFALKAFKHDEEEGDNDESEPNNNMFAESHDFQIYLLNSIEHYVNNHKSLLPFERERNLPYLRSVAKVLFFECFDKVGKGDSDDEKSVNKTRLCLVILCNSFAIFSKFHKDKIEQIFREITGKSACKDQDSLTYTLIKGCQKMIARILNHEEKDPLMKDATTILNIIVQVVQHMSHDCAEISKTHEWLHLLAEQQEIKYSPFCEELFKLMLNLNSQLKTNPTLNHQIAKDIYRSLGDNDQNVSLEDGQNSFAAINDDTVTGVITVLMNHVDEEFLLVEVSLNKQKSFLLTSSEHNADEVEKNISIKLGNIIRTINEIIKSALPLGTVMDLVIKKADKLYAVLALFVRYYLDIYKIKVHPKISEKFERLVNMSCELLSDPIYLFLNYVEDARSNLTKKGSSLQTALKESKLIPSLVFSIEKYEKLIIEISKKSKIDLHKNMKMSTLRDFKIETSKLAQNDPDEQDESEDETGEAEEVPSTSNKKRKISEDSSSNCTKKAKKSKS